MILKLLVAANAAKIRLKASTSTFGAFEGSGSFMLLMSVLTFTHGTPRVDIEAFASWQPPLADFLRSSRDELEALTIALLTMSNQLLLSDSALMIFE